MFLIVIVNCCIMTTAGLSVYFFALGCVQTDATLLTNNSQHCWMLHVASVCTPSCMLLDVVAQSLKPVKLFAPCKRTQHCWLTTPGIVGSCCARLHVALLWKAVSKRCSVSDWLISYGGKADSCRNICSSKNIRIRVDVAEVYGIFQVWMIFKTQLHSLVYGLLVVIFWGTLSSSWRVHVCLIPLLTAVYLWSRQEYFSFQVRFNFNWVRV